MNWKLKCLAFHALRLPGAARAHRFLQRYVTRRYFYAVRDLGVFNMHVDSYRKLGRPGRCLEFGAGSNLLSALLLSAAGAKEVFALDLNRIASIDRINHVIRQLRGKVAGDWPEVRDFADLNRLYRIRYIAPGDARATGLKAGSVDFFYSTSVMEHIPKVDLVSILNECKRIATPDALMSFWVGYYDHYATADKSITRLNFYRYNERQWRLRNPPMHYHNRLRHSDFERVFADIGLDALIDERILGELHELDGIPIAEQFRRYSSDDLLTVYGRFVLRDHGGGEMLQVI